jgi:hypothetical protein
MNIASWHERMVRDVFLNVELLLNGRIQELSEYDVQGMMFLALRAALANTGYRADRETSGKVDCVVFQGMAPRVMYEIKTYFKPREKVKVVDFQKDLKKLKTLKSKYADARAFFFVAAGKAKLKQAAVTAVPVLNRLIHPQDRNWTSFALADGTMVRLRPSRREQYGRSAVLTWEVK